jgi:hypothetical protein
MGEVSFRKNFRDKKRPVQIPESVVFHTVHEMIGSKSTLEPETLHTGAGFQISNFKF